MNPVIKPLILIGCALFEVSAYSQQLTIMQLQESLKHQYTPEAVRATGYIMGAYDAMTGIVHCPSGMTPTAAQLVAQVRKGLAQYHGPNRGADHVLAAVFAERAPCARRGLT
jgi:hypothetical protein